LPQHFKVVVSKTAQTVAFPAESCDAQYSLLAIDLAFAARNLTESTEHHGTHNKTTNQNQTKTHPYHPDITS
jgi:hypothetical protein